MKIDAKSRRKIHLGLMALWFVQIGVVFVLPTAWQVPYVIFCSVYANFATHWSAYSAETPVETEDAP